MSASQKRALVFPALQKSNLDPNLCKNFRPISNLFCLSKTIERLVSIQILPYRALCVFSLPINLDFVQTIPLRQLSFPCFLT